jgi:hypothetical protein
VEREESYYLENGVEIAVVVAFGKEPRAYYNNQVGR